MDQNVNLLENLFLVIKGIYLRHFSYVDLGGKTTYEITIKRRALYIRKDVETEQLNVCRHNLRPHYLIQP